MLVRSFCLCRSFHDQGVSPPATLGDRPRWLRSFHVAVLAAVALASTAGCNLIIPDVSHQPVVHNPFPQLSRVAVAPFFNQSDEPTVDGRDFAMAYYGELQAVPGFEVVPLGVVEEAIIAHRIDLSRPAETRRLAKVLGVDVVVIGAVTDYSPYYPPRCGLRVEWYAANPGFHEIPAGYGLPWGTPDEEYIPAPLVFEAEMALARAQLATQSPACAPPMSPESLMPVPKLGTPELNSAQPSSGGGRGGDSGENADSTAGDTTVARGRRGASAAAHQHANDSAAPDEAMHGDDNSTTEPLPLPGMPPDMPGNTAAIVTTGAIVAGGALPADWPDERGFIPPGPSPVRPQCITNDGPIMTHTRIYHGSDSEFTAALASYFEFRDDARFGGWQTYLQRSNDFIHFCCHMHISEMLSARGGAGETRVVWRWPESR